MKQQMIWVVCIALIVIADGIAIGSDWSTTLGFRTGFLVGPGEIGRDINATGGEELVAFMGSTAIAGGEIGIGNEYVAFIGSISAGLRQIYVKNEYGVDFPNHGKAPTRFIGAVSVYPFSINKGAIQPFLSAGIGLLLLSVDLNNVQDQDLYALFARSLGGGVELRMRTQTYVYVEYLQQRVSEKPPFHSFKTQAVTFGLGRRF